MTEKACDIQGWYYPHRWEVEWGYAGHGGYREEFQCPGVESLPLDPEPRDDGKAAALEAWASWSEQSEPGSDWESFWAGWRARREFYEKGDE